MSYVKLHSLKLFSAQPVQLWVWSEETTFLLYVVLGLLSGLSSFLCECVCVFNSVSLYFIYLFGCLCACRTLLDFFSFLKTFFLASLNLLNLFPISWLPLSCLSREERSVVLFLCSFSSNKPCDHSQVSNSLHFKFLPCLKRMMNPFYLPPQASLRRIQWDDHSEYNGCHC